MPLERPDFTLRPAFAAVRSVAGDRLRVSGLWVAGSLTGLERRCVAVVGTRAPSEGARVRARELGEALARAGVCVLSGLALGIDAAAHEGALAGGGETLGVLGGGHRRFFPRRNLVLAERMIARGGAVLSPYPPDEPARPGQFLERNGVITAFADAVVVVEAAERSGALNTAGWAASFGVDTLVYPGDVDRPKAAGCNALIRDGATLVRGPADVLDAIGVTPSTPRRSAAPQPRDPLEAAIIDGLAAGPADADTLVAVGLRGHQCAQIPAVVATLVRLELSGCVERRDGGTYALRGS